MAKDAQKRPDLAVIETWRPQILLEKNEDDVSRLPPVDLNPFKRHAFAEKVRAAGE